MRKIKVYLQYPWKFPDSPYYKYLVDNPPEGVEYVGHEKNLGILKSRKKFLFSNKIKSTIRKSFNFVGFSIPNSHPIKFEGDYDLVHCAHCLPKNLNMPWVADFEGEWQLYIGKKNSNSIKKVKKILEDKNCKAIICWTKRTYNDFLLQYPEIKEKLVVVYPAVPVNKNPKNKKKDVKILYASRYFYNKGGILAIESLKRIKMEKGVEVLFISDVPKKIEKKYSEIEIKKTVPQKELYNYYAKSEIFFYPSLADTFGFAILEAMSFGLPIVSIDVEKTKTAGGTPSVKEIVEDGKTGFVIDAGKDLNYFSIDEKNKIVVSKLVDKLEKLIKDKKLREKMSENCIKEIKSGKFSLRERNEKLTRIYKEALR